jgi:monolysocardiolipin acyltransferase
VTVTGAQHLKVLRDRPAGQGIVTVSNHPSTLDDPGMWGVLPWAWLTGDPARLRWTAIAEDICNRRLLSSVFFGVARGVPVVRGDGVYQPAMDWLLRVLNEEGAWVHFFAEGRVNQTAELLRFKWGVARLVMEATTTPLVLPIHLRGFEHMKPLGRALPRLGQALEVHVGPPVDLSERLRQLPPSWTVRGREGGRGCVGRGHPHHRRTGATCVAGGRPPR